MPAGAIDELVRNLITRSCHGDLLTPLDEIDESFELEIQHSSAKSFVSKLVDGNPTVGQAFGRDKKKVRAAALLDKIAPTNPPPSVEELFSSDPANGGLAWAATPLGGAVAEDAKHWVSLVAPGDRWFSALMSKSYDPSGKAKKLPPPRPAPPKQSGGSGGGARSKLD